MTLTNHCPASPAGAPAWTRTRLVAALLVSSGVVLSPLALVAAPLEAAPGAEVVATSGQVAPQEDARRPVTNDVVWFSPQVRDSGQTFEKGQWRWRVPTVQWAAAMAFGVLLAAAFILILLARVQRPSLVEPVASRRWLEDPIVWVYGVVAVALTVVVYGDFGWPRAMEWVAGVTEWRIDTVESAVPAALGFVLGALLLERLLATFRRPVLGSLVKTPLVWVYLLAAAGLAGALFAGSLQALSSEAGRVVGALAWAPTGVLSTVVGLLFTKATKRKMLIAAVAGEQSNSFVELMRAPMDDDFHAGVSALATVCDVGLIQRTMSSAIDRAADTGRLPPDKREECEGIEKALLEIQPGRDERSIFLNRRRAVEVATRLIAIEELETLLAQNDRRSLGDRRDSETALVGEERRTALERRVRSSWRPADDFELSA